MASHAEFYFYNFAQDSATVPDQASKKPKIPSKEWKREKDTEAHTFCRPFQAGRRISVFSPDLLFLSSFSFCSTCILNLHNR